jgi:hypothetical protein
VIAWDVHHLFGIGGFDVKTIAAMTQSGWRGMSRSKTTKASAARKALRVPGSAAPAPTCRARGAAAVPAMKDVGQRPPRSFLPG